MFTSTIKTSLLRHKSKHSLFKATDSSKPSNEALGTKAQL